MEEDPPDIKNHRLSPLLAPYSYEFELNSVPSTAVTIKQEPITDHEPALQPPISDDRSETTESALPIPEDSSEATESTGTQAHPPAVEVVPGVESKLRRRRPLLNRTATTRASCKPIQPRLAHHGDVQVPANQTVEARMKLKRFTRQAKQPATQAPAGASTGGNGPSSVFANNPVSIPIIYTLSDVSLFPSVYKTVAGTGQDTPLQMPSNVSEGSANSVSSPLVQSDIGVNSILPVTGARTSVSPSISTPNVVPPMALVMAPQRKRQKTVNEPIQSGADKPPESTASTALQMFAADFRSSSGQLNSNGNIGQIITESQSNSPAAGSPTATSTIPDLFMLAPPPPPPRTFPIAYPIRPRPPPPPPTFPPKTMQRIMPKPPDWIPLTDKSENQQSKRHKKSLNSLAPTWPQSKGEIAAKLRFTELTDGDIPDVEQADVPAEKSSSESRHQHTQQHPISGSEGTWTKSKVNRSFSGTSPTAAAGYVPGVTRLARVQTSSDGTPLSCEDGNVTNNIGAVSTTPSKIGPGSINALLSHIHGNSTMQGTTPKPKKHHLDGESPTVANTKDKQVETDAITTVYLSSQIMIQPSSSQGWEVSASPSPVKPDKNLDKNPAPLGVQLQLPNPTNDTHLCLSVEWTPSTGSWGIKAVTEPGRGGTPSFRCSPPDP